MAFFGSRNTDLWLSLSITEFDAAQAIYVEKDDEFQLDFPGRSSVYYSEEVIIEVIQASLGKNFE